MELQAKRSSREGSASGGAPQSAGSLAAQMAMFRANKLVAGTTLTSDEVIGLAKKRESYWPDNHVFENIDTFSGFPTQLS